MKIKLNIENIKNRQTGDLLKNLRRKKKWRKILIELIKVRKKIIWCMHNLNMDCVMICVFFACSFGQKGIIVYRLDYELNKQNFSVWSKFNYFWSIFKCDAKDYVRIELQPLSSCQFCWHRQPCFISFVWFSSFVWVMDHFFMQNKSKKASLYTNSEKQKIIHTYTHLISKFSFY